MLLYIYANLNMKYYENNANFYKWGKLIEIICIFLILHELHPMEKQFNSNSYFSINFKYLIFRILLI